MNMPALSFRPVTIERDVTAISRPSLSYWADAWIRLKANRRAFGSMFFIIAMILFGVVGPFFSRFDFQEQDLYQASKPPWADREFTVVAPYQPWSGLQVSEYSTSTTTSENLQLVGDATTDHVRIAWAPVRGASGYRVYRNTLDPQPDGPPGLPLNDVAGETATSFEDRLDLQGQSYWYSVVALDADGLEYAGFATLEVDVTRVITAAAAEERGLVEDASSLTIGEIVEYKWHPLGTDYLGRDMLARLMHGARVSLYIGIVAPLLFVIAGVLYGAAAGFLGGRWDHILMRFADFVVALPFLLFMILFKVVFGIEPGDSGITAMLIALVLLSWPATARLVRGQILQIREEGFVSASRLLGTKTRWLILRHMIPNTLGVILVTFTFAVPSAIFTEAFLSFIGMGVEPPTPSWGSMCNDGIKTMEIAPHELVFPALFISATVLAFNVFGDGLRDALDARMRGAE